MRRSFAAVLLLTLAVTVVGAATESKSGYLDVSGSKIYYEESGSRERLVFRSSGPVTIVLLHDGLLGAVSWDEIWDELAVKYHVIRYDRRGYGRSEAPTRAFSSTDDLSKLLSHLNTPHAVIVGSSSGGALAIDFAIAHPEMVDGLFLIGPVLHGKPYTKQFLERAHRNSEPMEQRDDVKATIRNWSEDRFLIANGHDQARKKFYDALTASPQNLKYDPQFEEKLSPPASERLAEIKAPTLILAGEADIADVHDHCRAINAGIRGSARAVVKDAGHLVQLEQPEEVVKRITDFLMKVGSKK